MSFDKNVWRIQELERELNEAKRFIAQQNAGMRNALTMLVDGDEEEAKEYLLQFVGEAPNCQGNRLDATAASPAE